MKNNVTQAQQSKRNGAQGNRRKRARRASREQTRVTSPRSSSADTLIDPSVGLLMMDTVLDAEPLVQATHSVPKAAASKPKARKAGATKARTAFAKPVLDRSKTIVLKTEKQPGFSRSGTLPQPMAKAKTLPNVRIVGHTQASQSLVGLARQRFLKAQTETFIPKAPRVSLVKRVFSRRTLARFAMGVATLVIAAHPMTRAVAENVMTQFRAPAPTAVLTDPRDPKDFMSELDVVMPRPTVVLTRQDAIAHELLKYNRTLSTRDILRTAQALNEQAQEIGLDPLLLLALMHTESYYDHLALSPVGAEGLMQLMPPTAEWMASRMDLRWDQGHTFDPVLNVRLGSAYLAYLNREFGRMDYALTAYNRGPHATRYIVDRFGALPDQVYDFYAGKVLGHYEKLKAMYGKLPMG